MDRPTHIATEEAKAQAAANTATFYDISTKALVQGLSHDYASEFVSENDYPFFGFEP